MKTQRSTQTRMKERRGKEDERRKSPIHVPSRGQRCYHVIILSRVTRHPKQASAPQASPGRTNPNLASAAYRSHTAKPTAAFSPRLSSHPSCCRQPRERTTAHHVYVIPWILECHFDLDNPWMLEGNGMKNERMEKKRKTNMMEYL